MNEAATFVRPSADAQRADGGLEVHSITWTIEAALSAFIFIIFAAMASCARPSWAPTMALATAVTSIAPRSEWSGTLPAAG